MSGHVLDVTKEAVENLVTQFSSALDFYRELVQNSIDAGSDTIEVWTEWADGMIVVHVVDAGEGMDEAIIDEQLTTLFSSSKENDLTKIGKFGIGFVSVFAVKPRAVVVKTGRGGEWWEVLFHEDRSFQKSRVDVPIEGTEVVLYIPGDPARYREFVGESLAVLRKWCVHSEAEILFSDRSDIQGESVAINEPFAVAGECAVLVDVEGTEMALAYDLAPTHGFYNKGLALAVVQGDNDLVPSRFRHITFKLKSRYLEHTLSRETVMRDGNYDKAIRLLSDAADGPLRSALVARIAAVVGDSRPWGVRDIEVYVRLMELLLRESAALAGLTSVPLLRMIDGRAVGLDQVAEAAERDGHAYVVDQTSALADRLLETGSPVLLDRIGDGPVARLVANDLDRRRRGSLVGRFRRLVGATPLTAPLVVDPSDVLLDARVLDDPEDPAVRLVAATERVLDRAFPPRGTRVAPFAAATLERESGQLGYDRVACCFFTGDWSGDPPLFVVARRVGGLMAVPPSGRVGHERLFRPQAAVNREHPHFRSLLGAFATQPALAAYCLAKALLLAEDRIHNVDAQLMVAAREELG